MKIKYWWTIKCVIFDISKNALASSSFKKEVLLKCISKLKDIFGEKCLYFENRHRVNDYDTDWAGGRNVRMSDAELIKETQDCIIDVLAASRCNFLMGGASNMMLGALSFNKDLHFKIFNVLSNKIGR